MAQAGASVSSSCHYGQAWNFVYDVFLSFRGEDTRHSFTGHLYDALSRKGIGVFIDDEGLRRGEEMSTAIDKAIEGSRISVIVFSENYTSSRWCLDELLKIIDCMKNRGQLVLPVFYKIDPRVVRRLGDSQGEAMGDHRNKFRDNQDKVTKWCSALCQAAKLSGWHVEFGYEFQFIQRIVEDISRRLNCPILHVAANPVGLESRICQVISQLGLEFNDDVHMLGIYGIGGIGKSTIARAVYNSIAHQFDGVSFLNEVRETSSKRGLVQLQEKLLSDTLGGKNLELGDVYKGILVIKRRLSRKKVLLILDDVNKLEQLQTLAGMPHWFGSGSRIIITTRDKHLLTSHNVTRFYEVQLLNRIEALELFSWNAFSKREPDSIFENISKRVVHYAEHLPLAIEVIGRAFVGRSLEEWEDALGMYANVPEGEIYNKLRISLDDLNDFEKKILLDIACFFKGEGLKYVHRILEACDLFPTIGIRKLIDKGLLSISPHDSLCMHNLIQEMAKEIVRRESPSNVGKRSRLWFDQDVIKLLTENMGSDEVEGIMLDLSHLPQPEEIAWSGEAFEKMKNLRILIIKNANFSQAPGYLPNNLRLLHWVEYPSSSFPPSFCPKKLAVLEAPCNRLTFEKPFKNFLSLTRLNISRCDSLTKVPDISALPSLQEFVLDYCENLVEIHISNGFPSKLVKLSAINCTKLTCFSQGFKLNSLEQLSLAGCSEIHRFPALLKITRSLHTMNLKEAGVEELPSSTGILSLRRELDVHYCKELNSIPLTKAMQQSFCKICLDESPLLRSILSHENYSIECSSAVLSRFFRFFHNPNLIELDLRDCNLSCEEVLIIPRYFPSLVVISLKGNQFETVPASFRELQYLEKLDLSDCMKLQEFPSIIPYMPKLRRIYTFNCKALSPQSANFLLEMGKRFTGPRDYRNFSVKNADPLHIAVPGTRIPEWILHRSEGGFISFYARGNFPNIILCISFRIDGNHPASFLYNLYMFINEIQVSVSSRRFKLQGNDHLWLFDLREFASSHSVDNSHEDYIQNKWDRANWNLLKIWCNFCHSNSDVQQAIVKECGIHFYEEETNMEDICFSCPSSTVQSNLDS